MGLKTLKILILIFFVTQTLPIQGARASYSQPLPVNAEYLGLIQQQINPYCAYPQEALITGWEGVVKVKFTLMPDGRIKDIDIAESSGYPLLDAAAILAVKDASPYPFPQDDFEEGELEITIPVEYISPKSELAVEPNLKDAKELAPADETQSVSPAIPSLQYTPPVLKEAKEKMLAQETPITVPLETKASAIPPEILQPPAPEPPSQENLELKQFIKLAVEHNQPTEVARQEIELAQLKVTEAQRNLFPMVKVSAYDTNGTATQVDYQERETKVQVDHPLFYEGRLGNAINQAKTNLEITQKNYERLKLDVIHKTETAYYNLLGANINMQQREQVYREATDMAQKLEELSVAGMITGLELNSARSWLGQLEFQINGTKQELFMAKLAFKQALNIKEMPDVRNWTLEIKKLDLNLEQCIDVALRNRPEIKLSEMLVKFNEYGQKIEHQKAGAFMVDLTGSYGYYQGHWRTEPWKESNNWYAGIKVTKPWGENTINGAYASEEIAERYGTTSPTKSSTFSAEVNILDGMRRLSDKKKSNIDILRSLSDFNETFKTITFEVQDAFLNYQKSILQFNTAEAEMKFRRSEINVMKVRSMVGEVPFSSALESLLNYSESQTKYIQALANYHIYLAALKKACGYGLQI